MDNQEQEEKKDVSDVEAAAEPDAADTTAEPVFVIPSSLFAVESRIVTGLASDPSPVSPRCHTPT